MDMVIEIEVENDAEQFEDAGFQKIPFNGNWKEFINDATAAVKCHVGADLRGTPERRVVARWRPFTWETWNELFVDNPDLTKQSK